MLLAFLFLIVSTVLFTLSYEMFKFGLRCVSSVGMEDVRNTGHCCRVQERSFGLNTR